jgi:hypothetical protein
MNFISREDTLNIPGHKGNANQITLRFHLTPVRMVIFENINNKCWKDVGKKEPSYTAGENVR